MPGAMPKIIIKKGNLLVKKFSIPEEILAFTVGSEQGNDILVEDEKVSFFHLQFEKQNEDYYVRDLQSQHGTYVNSRKISGRTQIKDNDEIGLGSHKLTFLHPKNEPELITETIKRSGRSSVKLEERIAGVPTLMNLNSWLNGNLAGDGFERNGDFFVENNGPLRAEKPIDFMPAKREQPAMSLFENAPSPDLNPELTLVENNRKKEPLFAMGTETMVQTQPMPSPKLELAESSAPAGLVDAPIISTEPATGNYYLLGIYGYYLGRKFRLRHSDTRIGRDGKVNDIIIKKNSRGKIDQSVSRRHATITYRNGQYILLDKRSKSRTYLNQYKIEPTDNVEIKRDDEIEIISDRKNHILRMVPEGKWDFSHPKKAGAWYVRHYLKLLAVYSLILAAFGVFVFGRSLMTRNLIADKPDPLLVSETKWFSTGTSATAPNDGLQQLSPPAIADFDGDQIIDFVYTDQKGSLVCISGQNQKAMWTSSDFQINAGAPITVEDLNKDGRADIIIISKDLRVRALDGHLGIEIWKSPILAGPLVAPAAVGDFNRDGLKDLAIVSETNSIYIGYVSLGTAPRWVKQDIEAPLRGVVSVEDIYNDGGHKIIVGTENGKIIFIDGFNQKILGEININEEFSKATGIFGLNHQIRYPIAIGELNGDQTKDIVVLTQQGGLMALSGSTLERLWYDLPDTNANLSDGINQNLLLGDLDGDNLLDVVSRTPDGRLRAFKGNGQGKDRKMVLWEKNDNYFLAFPSLTDFNKNGTLDVVTADITGQLFVIEGSSGDVMWKNGMKGPGLVGPMLIGDIDNDHHLDIVAHKSDGNVFKLSTNCVTASQSVMWGQVFGNSQNTNSVVTRQQDIRMHYALMSGSVLLIVAVAAFNYFVRKKRKDLARA